MSPTRRGVKTLDNSPNLFTIADLSDVWIMCDVYENDLRSVHLGEYADIKLNAYPDQVFTGRIGKSVRSSIPQSAPLKSAWKWPIPGMMRLGMFVTATFHGRPQESEARCRPRRFCTCTIATGSMCPRADNTFRRMEVDRRRDAAAQLQEVADRHRARRSKWSRTRWSCRVRRSNR